MQGVVRKSGSATFQMNLTVNEEGTLTSGATRWDPYVAEVRVDGPFLAEPESDTLVQAGSTRMVWRDGVVLVNGRDSEVDALKGREWLRADLPALADRPAGARLNSGVVRWLAGAGQDPTKYLALLADAPDLRHLGAESLDDVPTQRYKGRLALEEVLGRAEAAHMFTPIERAAVGTPAERVALTGGSARPGGDKLLIEMWVDEDQHPKRISLRLDATPVWFDCQLAYLNPGIHFDAEEPSPDEILDWKQLSKPLDTLLLGVFDEGGAAS